MAIQDLIQEWQDTQGKIAQLTQQIADLRAAGIIDQGVFVDLQSKYDATVTSDNQVIADLKAQLAQLQSTVTYSALEYGFWQLNLKPDAASGLGKATLTPADNPKSPALFSIMPDAPLTGQADNYFNAYATQKKLPDAKIKNFVLTGRWDFPTDGDMNRAHAIEMEARQVLPLVSPATLPLMAVPALQMRFGGNEPLTLRYFNALAAGDNWVATGIPLIRQRTQEVVLEAHRDDTNFYYDAMTLNGVRHAMSFVAPLYAKTYVNERLSVSLQLDSHYLAGAYKVNVSNVSLKVY